MVSRPCGGKPQKGGKTPKAHKWSKADNRYAAQVLHTGSKLEWSKTSPAVKSAIAIAAIFFTVGGWAGMATLYATSTSPFEALAGVSNRPRVYYSNEVTGAVQWNRPTCLGVKKCTGIGDVTCHREWRSKAGGTSTAIPPECDWEIEVRGGRTVYVNKQLQQEVSQKPENMGWRAVHTESQEYVNDPLDVHPAIALPAQPSNEIRST